MRQHIHTYTHLSRFNNLDIFSTPFWRSRKRILILFMLINLFAQPKRVFEKKTAQRKQMFDLKKYLLYLFKTSSSTRFSLRIQRRIQTTNCIYLGKNISTETSWKAVIVFENAWGTFGRGWVSIMENFFCISYQ